MCIRERRWPATVMAIISVFIFLLSAISLGLSLKFYNTRLFGLDGELYEFSNSIFTLLLSFSLLALLTACTGLFASRCKYNRCPVIIFGFFLTFIWVTFFGLGYILTWFSDAQVDQIKAYCDLDATERSQGGLTNNILSATISDIDTELTGIITQLMCTETLCPCPSDQESIWVNGYSENTLNKFKRTAKK